MKIAVVGYGAVGRRHARNARDLGHDVVLIRRQGTGNADGFPERHDLPGDADVFVLATPTADHAADLPPLLSTGRPVLCEKPVCATGAQARAIEPCVMAAADRCRVVVQLRYHPLVERVVQWINDGRIGSVRYVSCVVGQYLPDWRPGRQVRETYSAHTGRGGGVVLDLIHDIDLACLFAGAPAAPAVGMAARLSDVTVDAVDCADLVFRSMTGALVHVHQDYLYRGLLRHAVVVGTDGALHLDLAAGHLMATGTTGAPTDELCPPAADRNEMFVALLEEYLRSIDQGTTCRLPTGADMLRLQDALWPVLGRGQDGERDGRVV